MSEDNNSPNFRLRFLKTPLSVVLSGILLLTVCLLKFIDTSNQVVEAGYNRYVSSLLADEMRQSSDDLTRIARTYVSTGDTKWEKQYFEILDIRNGKIPRPENYEKIYWDFRAAGTVPPSGKTTTVALPEMMKLAGFSDAEFKKLSEAQKNSNDLVSTETIAMNMVKGLYQDSSGGFSKRGTPDRTTAIEMMHNDRYHLNKAKIMKPVNEFLMLLDARTQKGVDSASEAQQFWSMASLVLLVSTLISAVWALYQWYWINSRLGGLPDDVVAMVKELSRGKLTGRQVKSGMKNNSVMASLIDMREQLVSIFTTMQGGAQHLALTTSDIGESSHHLALRAEEQARDIQSTAATMGELQITVKNNAEHVKSANQLTTTANSVARKGSEVFENVVATMDDITESSKRIADITTVIDGIAFQTNLLALNAAVEAARAGENGKGFAVVASEVGSLARRSADAAKEINGLITESQSKVNSGTELVSRAGETMEEILQSIKDVDVIVNEISVSSTEQSIGVQQISDVLNNIDAKNHQNSELVTNSNRISEDLRHRADEFLQVVEQFELPDR